MVSEDGNSLGQRQLILDDDPSSSGKKEKSETLDNFVSPYASEEFNDALFRTSSIRATCDLCGKTYFSESEGADFEEGELEELKKLAKEQPDKYEENSEWIPNAYIDGKQVVCDCTCGKLRRYERFIWSHRRFIAEYLKRRTARLLQEAQDGATARLLQEAQDNAREADKIPDVIP
jgi:hypothetical protein